MCTIVEPILNVPQVNQLCALVDDTNSGSDSSHTLRQHCISRASLELTGSIFGEGNLNVSLSTEPFLGLQLWKIRLNSDLVDTRPDLDKMPNAKLAKDRERFLSRFLETFAKFALALQICERWQTHSQTFKELAPGIQTG